MASERLTTAIDEAWSRMRAAPGFLTEREGRFLALAAAAAPGEGVILEIGSFMGKSTVGLASAARALDRGVVVAVDPFTAPSSTDPDLHGSATSYDDFVKTLSAAGLLGEVEAHRMFSSELAATWNRPIRFLWIDGDHTYAGAKADFDNFKPFLTPGAVVALHDTLHPFDGPIRVVVEDMLPSNDFGPVGFVGSIAWAQYRPADGGSPAYVKRRRNLADRARRLIPFTKPGTSVDGLRGIRYRFWRSRVPHAAVVVEDWLADVAFDQPG